MKPRHEAATVASLLRAKYAAPAWAFLEQVRNGTGYSARESYADAVAMSLWPSRGLEVNGFEIKVTRQDLLSELAQPQKSVPVQKFCDRWWLVLGDKEIIRPGELPPTWGLMVVEGDKKLRLKAITEAPKLEAQPLSMRFVASLLRNFEQSFVPRRVHAELEREMQKKVREGIDAQIEQEKKFRLRDVDHWKSRAEKAEEMISQFGQRSGMSLSEWNWKMAADAAAVGSALTSAKNGLQHVINAADRLASVARESLTVIEEESAA